MDLWSNWTGIVVSLYVLIYFLACTHFPKEEKHNGNANTGILIEHIKINRNDSEEVTSKEH